MDERGLARRAAPHPGRPPVRPPPGVPAHRRPPRRGRRPGERDAGTPFGHERVPPVNAWSNQEEALAHPHRRPAAAPAPPGRLARPGTPPDRPGAGPAPAPARVPRRPPDSAAVVSAGFDRLAATGALTQDQVRAPEGTMDRYRAALPAALRCSTRGTGGRTSPVGSGRHGVPLDVESTVHAPARVALRGRHGRLLHQHPGRGRREARPRGRLPRSPARSAPSRRGRRPAGRRGHTRTPVWPSTNARPTPRAPSP